MYSLWAWSENKDLNSLQYAFYQDWHCLSLLLHEPLSYQRHFVVSSPCLPSSLLHFQGRMVLSLRLVEPAIFADVTESSNK